MNPGDVNKGTKTRSNLAFEVLLVLNQFYMINPYPDRFQMGAIGRHCELDGARVKHWFQNRRVQDGRKGKLCRQCRYFKSPSASEELHVRDPYSRPCVYLSMEPNNQPNEPTHQDHQNVPMSTALAPCPETSSMNDNQFDERNRIPSFYSSQQEPNMQFQMLQQTRPIPHLIPVNPNLNQFSRMEEVQITYSCQSYYSVCQQTNGIANFNHCGIPVETRQISYSVMNNNAIAQQPSWDSSNCNYLPPVNQNVKCEPFNVDYSQTVDCNPCEIFDQLVSC